ncbi:unnamed protein product, partial [Vitis vinifera]
MLFMKIGGEGNPRLLFSCCHYSVIAHFKRQDSGVKDDPNQWHCEIEILLIPSIHTKMLCKSNCKRRLWRPQREALPRRSSDDQRCGYFTLSCWE